MHKTNNLKRDILNTDGIELWQVLYSMDKAPKTG